MNIEVIKTLKTGDEILVSHARNPYDKEVFLYKILDITKTSMKFKAMNALTPTVSEWWREKSEILNWKLVEVL